MFVLRQAAPDDAAAVYVVRRMNGIRSRVRAGRDRLMPNNSVYDAIHAEFVA